MWHCVLRCAQLENWDRRIESLLVQGCLSAFLSCIACVSIQDLQWDNPQSKGIYGISKGFIVSKLIPSR
jgi:hypothetical protein